MPYKNRLPPLVSKALLSSLICILLGLSSFCTSTPPLYRVEENPDLAQRPYEAVVEIQVSKLAIQGGLSEQQFLRSLKRHLDKFTYCYEDSLASSPKLEGQLTFILKIEGKSGLVLKAQVLQNQSTLENRYLDKCFTYHFSEITFEPVISGDSEVKVNFIFLTRKK